MTSPLFSVCAKCGSQNRWELADAPVADAAHKLFFVRCAGCRAPVGVLEAGNITALVGKMQGEVTELRSITTKIAHSLNEVIDALNRRH